MGDEHDIVREGSTTSSKASSTAGSEGVPESVGPASATTALLTEERLKILEENGLKAKASIDTLSKWFNLWGIAPEQYESAHAKWEKYAVENGLTPASAAASASASSSAKPLTPAMLSRISETFSTTQTPSTMDLRKVFKSFGVPRTVWVIAEKQWNEWAKDNHTATDDDDLELDD